MHRKWLLVLPIISLIWFTSVIIIGGYFYPNYSHVTQFISELGATGSPYGKYVNYLGFIPSEIFILAFVVISYTKLPRTKVNMTGLILITIYGLSLGVAALFPCDFECRPETSTLSHDIHMLSAFPGYLCGIMSVFMLASGSSQWAQKSSFKVISFILGFVCLYLFLNLDPSSTWVGIYQRSLDALIYLWFIYFAYNLRRYQSNHCNV